MVGKFKNIDQFADVGINLREILTWILVNEVERTRGYLRIGTMFDFAKTAVFLKQEVF